MSNPRGPADAAAYAIAQVGQPVTPNRCDHFVGVCCGYAHSGFPSAAAHWAFQPEKHRNDYNAPVGALVFFAPNHVAISIGGSECVSTDFPHSGVIGRGTIADVASKMGVRYLGWSPPNFGAQGSGNVVEGSSGFTPQQGDTQTTSDPASPRDWKASVTTTTQFLTDGANWHRIGIGAAGAGLIIAAAYLLIDGTALSNVATLTKEIA